MSTQTPSHYEIVSHMPPDAVVTFHSVSWEEYEQLLDEVGESSGFRISYDDGTLQIMTLSSEHEKYVRFFESLITAIRLRLHINIISFGSATIKRRGQKKGEEPDACFYIQSAAQIGNKLQLDFSKDPPPDLAVEVDIHHESDPTLSIYAGLRIGEVWRFDGRTVTINVLQAGNYVEVGQSRALPLLSNQILTDSLKLLQTAGELQAIIDFDRWLESQQHTRF